MRDRKMMPRSCVWGRKFSLGALTAISVAVVLGSGTPSAAVDSSASYGRWAVFVDEEARPKARWAATHVKTDNSYFLYVTRFRGRLKPELSVFVENRMRRSTGLSFQLGGRKFQAVARPNGAGHQIWPNAGADDSRIVKMLSAADGPGGEKPGQLLLLQNGKAIAVFILEGSGTAIAHAIRECKKP